ncbi:hypothetical protein HOT31_gp086 [Microbacterium phage Hendrix]|uniref:Uncharacterized protein n=1 Tax=Microbacterium phage Hendrix TaxID=2182341 RepID=A0A2U8UUK3_9CAUD|nr:hypothetical protein HOT31_gp086 [Microbacterium phage Hendrix]AWN07757.1 hypothetical protein PBI_HENDRIX_86 [Microbacterium phage Hendrix]
MMAVKYLIVRIDTDEADVLTLPRIREAVHAEPKGTADLVLTENPWVPLRIRGQREQDFQAVDEIFTRILNHAREQMKLTKEAREARALRREEKRRQAREAHTGNVFTTGVEYGVTYTDPERPVTMTTDWEKALESQRFYNRIGEGKYVSRILERTPGVAPGQWSPASGPDGDADGEDPDEPEIPVKPTAYYRASDNPYGHGTIVLRELLADIGPGVHDITRWSYDGGALVIEAREIAARDSILEQYRRATGGE